MEVKPWKPTREQVEGAKGKRLTDVIAEELDVLFCGINPSLYSAAVGHHFARPGNRFWPAIHGGGFTERILSPFEDRTFVQYGCGLTNLVSRATAQAAEVANEEFVAGGKRLLAKVKRYRPRIVAFMGITAYRVAFARPNAPGGRQPDLVGEAIAWVLPSPSGLNAHYHLPELSRLFAEMRAAVPRENNG